MRLKYQLRGLGIGLFIAALIMGITGNDKVDASIGNNEEINTQQESTVQNVDEESEEITLQDSIIKTEEESTQEPVIIRDAQTSEENMQETYTQTSEAVSETVETVSQKESIEEMESEITSSVVIQISNGDDSGTVSRKLKDAGLIDSASDFDAYLMQHGYDKKISAGTVKIEPGSTWIEIADKLAGK